MSKSLPSRPNLDIEQLKSAFEKNDAPLFRQLLENHPEIKAKINEPIGPFDSPAITLLRTRGMLDVLLEAGARLGNRKIEGSEAVREVLRCHGIKG